MADTRLSRVAAGRFLLLCFGFVSACSPPQAKVTASSASAVDLTRALRRLDDLDTVGLQSPASLDGELGVVERGQFSPNGELIALLDLVSPHIKLFDRRGVFIRALAPSRQNSGADRVAARPVGFAMSDSLVVLMYRDGDHLAGYQVDGRPAFEVDSLPFAPETGVALATGDWLFYGASRATADGRRKWLHCVSYLGKESQTIVSGLEIADSLHAEFRGIRGMERSASGAVVQHMSRGKLLLLSVGCDRTARANKVRIDTIAICDSDSSDVFLGMAAIPGGVIKAVAATNGTKFVFEPDGGPPVLIRESLLLLGGANDQLLLFGIDPVPHGRIVSTNAFRGALFPNEGRKP